MVIWFVVISYATHELHLQLDRSSFGTNFNGSIALEAINVVSGALRNIYSDGVKTFIANTGKTYFNLAASVIIIFSPVVQTPIRIRILPTFFFL